MTICKIYRAIFLDTLDILLFYYGIEIFWSIFNSFKNSVKKNTSIYLKAVIIKTYKLFLIHAKINVFKKVFF
jgi:hypothetical protein